MQFMNIMMAPVSLLIIPVKAIGNVHRAFPENAVK